MRKNLHASAVIALCLGSPLVVAAPVVAGRVELGQEMKHDVSPPLRDITPIRPTGPNREIPLRRFRAPETAQPQADPVVQSVTNTGLAPITGINFEGVGQGAYGFTPNSAPPDTNGSAGATQYVQWVNSSFAVFDKSGNLLYGPAAGNTLWSGFGGGCQTNNDGDVIAQYDKAANRWVLSQFSVTNGPPYLQCFAVSTTSDATGTFNRYAFTLPNFNDYPKIGLWPDAYYASFNMFSGNTFVGARACAFDRSKMLTGAAATMQCFQLGASYGGLLPSDLDGSTAPPAGSPDFYLNFGANSLNLWKFHVDWTTPSNSTFTGPVNIPVAAFSAACSGGGTCIPQQGTTRRLDSLADRLMYRLAYRNFGDHESLVVNHSVTAGSSVGIRWYELRGPNGAPAVYQQGTYAPDSSFRWMGSAGMDRAGDIAVGYSVSSSSLFPSIRYTGRVPADPLGTLEAEVTLISGTGSQTGISRWGDYSGLSIDPVDDCTFWYTTEYLKSNGSFNWSTRIGSFQFPGCGAAGTPDFTISAAPASLTIAQGSSKISTITTAVSGGFNAAISLSASGLPAGATAAFNPSSIPAPGSGTSAMTITVGSSAAAGTYAVTVTGSGGGITHTTAVSLTITSSGGGGGNIIVDGGFESATASGMTAPGWTATTNVSGHNVIIKGGAYPRAGTNYAVLGGVNNENETLTQTVSIPGNATAAALIFWANVVTGETGSTVYDRMAVEIHNTSGTLLATVYTLSNVSASQSNNTNGTYFQTPQIDLSAYKGQTVQIVFHTTTDASLLTVFRVDDVALNVTTAGGGLPVTSITSPANGATVSGTTTVTATASSSAGIAKMELYIDNALVSSNTNSTSLSYSWNTTAAANGSHTLQSKAYDPSNNAGTSPLVTVTVSNGGTQQLLGNPGFENGAANPAPWTATAGVISNAGAEPPHAGSWDAWLDGYGSPHTDTLAQTVAIPASITTATLSFWLHIDTAETGSVAYDKLTVQLRNTSGAVLTTLAQYSNLNANTGYAQKSFNISAYKGQTVQVYLIGTEDASLQTSFVVDDFALNVQ